MPDPSFLVIEEAADGVFLYRYDAYGKCAGDTWHASIEEAKGQAKYEYQDRLRDWIEIPSSVQDVTSFGLARSGEAK